MQRDEEAVQIFFEESEEHLAFIESDLLAIEKDGADVDLNRINKVFRTVHTVKGGAGFLGFETIKTLAHKMENVMGMIRENQLTPTPEVTSVLLSAADTLQEMILNLDASNEVDISSSVKALSSIMEEASTQDGPKPEKSSPPPSSETPEKKEEPIQPAKSKIQKPAVIRDQEAVEIFAEESAEHLADVEGDLLTIEKSGSDIDLELVNKVFRAVHTVKGGAGFLNYENIKNLAHKMENIMGKIREQKLEPTPEIISALLDGADSLRRMISTLDNSDEEDITDQLQILIDIVSSEGAPPPSKPATEEKEVEIVPVSIPQVKKKRQKAKKPAPPSSPAKTDKEQKGAGGSLRVNLRLLDQLMNLAGEMVLSRNQLVQAVDSKNLSSIELVKQRIDIITSELQESIMFTRMQPIANVFNRFPRLARELSIGLGKEVELTIDGADVELDKTIIEAISAPLTHLIRNSIDHGIEMPWDRERAKKDKKGQIILRAGHEAGVVIIEVIDDGKGMSPDKILSSVIEKGILNEEQTKMLSEKEKLQLIFLPGFSTAESVTEVSGRGVGMDVVQTNIEKLGGHIDISSTPGKGTEIRIKLPLTLAIISAQIVMCRNQRYSIPQVSLEELLRVQPQEIKDKIEVIGNAPVLKLRNDLLPLVRLVDVLGVPNVYIDPETDEEKIDQRKNIADRRSIASDFWEALPNSEQILENDEKHQRSEGDRRSKHGTLYIAIVNTGNLKYGIVVDALKDAEEIVVKPLGSHLKNVKIYSGSTIMGDGRVSLILDIANIAKQAKLISYENSARSKQINKEQEASALKLKDLQSFLLFKNGGQDQLAVPLNLVVRVIKIKSSAVEYTGGKKVLQYGDENLPLFSIDELAKIPPIIYQDDLLVIIFKIGGQKVGLLATKPINAVETILSIDEKTHIQPGIMGSFIIDEKITLLVNMYEVVQTLNPHWFSASGNLKSITENHTILIAEDSTFFQSQITKSLKEIGFKTILAEDGQLAWKQLQLNRENISLLVTDIEMPNMDGLQLTQKIREDEQVADLPIIALTTLTGEENVLKGKEAGVDEYLVKFDRDLLLENIFKLLEINQ